MWGQVHTALPSFLENRIIPTRVGTRRELQAPGRKAEDHPHACGDKNLRRFFMWDMLGSSPRVWGQVICYRNIFCFARIIPTRVGTRFISCCSCFGCEDHPHACGDKFDDKFRFLGGFRIIPTRVGTSYDKSLTTVSPKDHPHACGDKTKEIKENSGFAKSTA